MVPEDVEGDFVIPERIVTPVASTVVPEDHMSQPLYISSSPYPFSAMTPPPATTPSPQPQYHNPYSDLKSDLSMFPRNSGPPPTPRMVYSPAPLPQMGTSPSGTSVQSEECFAPLVSSNAEVSSANAQATSPHPNLDDMDESQLEDHLKVCLP